MTDDAQDLLALELVTRGPSAIMRGRQDFDAVMEDGTPQQKEAVLMVLRVVSRIKPGQHAATSLDFAIEALRRAMA